MSIRITGYHWSLCLLSGWDGFTPLPGMHYARFYLDFNLVCSITHLVHLLRQVIQTVDRGHIIKHTKDHLSHPSTSSSVYPLFLLMIYKIHDIEVYTCIPPFSLNSIIKFPVLTLLPDPTEPLLTGQFAPISYSIIIFGHSTHRSQASQLILR